MPKPREDGMPRLNSSQYRGVKGAKCPWCLSKDIEAGPLDADGEVATSDVSCNGCGSEWQDVYELTGFRGI